MTMPLPSRSVPKFRELWVSGGATADTPTTARISRSASRPVRPSARPGGAAHSIVKNRRSAAHRDARVAVTTTRMLPPSRKRDPDAGAAPLHIARESRCIKA
ncbi:hypothetical protein ACIU1J_02335 [Azospirillum doebereinerae]|uniref:hypothetical protein n=1 Tax=Azospirillum doebereinerae TaxID=92933 RepID=UPI00384EFFF4